MTAYFSDIFALACAIAGWFYLFYSKAATRLALIENASPNALRIKLRRICGAAMLLLGAAAYAGSNAIDAHRHPELFLWVWMGSILLLALIVILVAADIYLTWKLHQKSRSESGDHP